MSREIDFKAHIYGMNGPRGSLTGTSSYRQYLGYEFFCSFNYDGTILALAPFYGNRVRIFKYRTVSGFSPI